jgi:glycerol-1-phosphate dehydrogenase [NAD(P)+]
LAVLVSTRTINIPTVLDIRAGALDALPAVLAASFDVRRTLVVSGRTASLQSAMRVREGLAAIGATVAAAEGIDGSVSASAALAGALRADPPTLVVAVGGGRAIDAAKLAAAQTGIPFVAVPTMLSHDGMASPVASLVGADGIRTSLASGMPAGVVIDLDVVGSAPAEYARAGVGDLVSNLTAVADWRLAADSGGEPLDEFAASIALQSALPVLGVEWPLQGDDLQLVARGLVMSGLAMEVAGSSRPCSGAEHLISHALDQLLGPKARAHGEQVALGVLVVGGASGVDVARVRELYRRVGLPVDLDEAGLERSTLVEAVRLAPSTRPGRTTVLDRLDLTERGVQRLLDDAFGA